MTRTFTIPLGTLTGEGMSIPIGPDQTRYANSTYVVAALCWNLYTVTDVRVQTTTLLNQFTAKSTLAAWVTADPNQALPTSDDQKRLQVSACGPHGKSWFSARSMNQTLTVPQSTNPWYSTGSGDAGSTGSNFQNQGLLQLTVIGPDKAIESYAEVSLHVTVRFSSPGAPNLKAAVTNTNLPSDSATLSKWARIDTLDAMVAMWRYHTSGVYLCIENANILNCYPLLRTLPEYTNEPTVPEMQAGYKTWITSTTQVPQKNYLGNPLTKVTVYAWNDEKAEWQSEDQALALGYNIWDHMVVQPMTAFFPEYVVQQETGKSLNVNDRELRDATATTSEIDQQIQLASNDHLASNLEQTKKQLEELQALRAEELSQTNKTLVNQQAQIDNLTNMLKDLVVEV